jgi:hypothetical protein
MILFINKVKIKWEWNDHIERKKKESQFLANKMLKDEIKKTQT